MPKKRVSGKKKKLPIIEHLEITDIAAEGMAIAKSGNMVVFVPSMIPGDIADIQITRKRKKFMTGYPVRIVKESDQRVKPFCKHFGVCGGCKWQNLPYAKQLEFKQKQVADSLQRIGKIEFLEISPIIGSKQQQYYRNKLEYTFSERRWLSNEEIKRVDQVHERKALGFHIPGKFDRILDIHECFLQQDLSNRIRNAIREYTLIHDFDYYDQATNKGFLRNLIIRNTQIGEWMVVLVFEHDEAKAIKELMEFICIEFPEINSLAYVINSKVNDTIQDLDIKLFSGRDHIIEKINDLKFKIGTKSFFQTNTLQAKELYQVVAKFADLSGEELVYDLYTGTGTIACYIAKECRKVIGIEYIKAAVEDAKTNAELNGFHNAEFYAGDLNNILNNAFIEKNGKPDVIITDPPRAGMHPDVVKTILDILPSSIVYVSCNPATQARDINLMSEKYKIIAVQPVDMFPHTHHVENVVALRMK